MKAQDKAKASAHAPIVKLAELLRRTGPDQLDELLETRLDDPEQLRQVLAQLEQLAAAAEAARAHVGELNEGITAGDCDQ